MKMIFSMLFVVFIIPLFSSAEPLIDIITGMKSDGSLNVSDIVQQLKDFPKNRPYENNFYDLLSLKSDIEDGMIHEGIKKRCFGNRRCIELATTSLLQAQEDARQEMEEMVLFPAYYKPIGAGAGYRGDAREAIECNQCSSRSIRDQIWAGSDREYSDFYRLIRQKGADCIEEVLTELFRKIDNARIPQRCLEEEYQNNHVCQTINNDTRIRESRIEMLTSLYDDLSNTESNICLPIMNDRIDNMKDFLNEIQESKMCSPLQIGEKRMMPLLVNNPGVPYTVQKEQDGSYSVMLNMRFRIGRGYDGEAPISKVPEHYQEKTQQCLQQANPKLLGPNGEKLNIIISNPQNKCEELKTQDIYIMSSDHRSNMIKYASDADCTTILHEILHQFGLGDEYDERPLFEKEDPRAVPETEVFSRMLQEVEYAIFGKSRSTAYDCRLISDNSIMGNHLRERWEDVIENEEQSSLLSPRHFNLIVYGRCAEKNQKFIECNRQAYLHSREDPSCLERKRECESLYHSH